jgi:hypothetical protein
VEIQRAEALGWDWPRLPCRGLPSTFIDRGTVTVRDLMSDLTMSVLLFQNRDITDYKAAAKKMVLAKMKAYINERDKTQVGFLRI